MPAQGDPIFTVSEAAAYCRVTRQAIRRAIIEGGGQFEQVESPHEAGPRIIQGVSKGVIDKLRAAGFLTNKPGRRPNKVTRRSILTG